MGRYPGLFTIFTKGNITKGDIFREFLFASLAKWGLLLEAMIRS